MKRWCITRMGDYEGDGSISQKLTLYPCSFRSWTKPGASWCFAQMAAADLTAIQADPDIYILPDATMDASVGSIPSAVRNNMLNKLQAAGFVTTDIKISWTIRQTLQYIAQQLQTGINVEAGDVADITN